MSKARTTRRGRPLMLRHDDTAASTRRDRVREAQRQFRQRKEGQLLRQQQRIEALEKALERVSSSFLDLSGIILQSQQAQASPWLIATVEQTTKDILDSTKAVIPQEDYNASERLDTPVSSHAARVSLDESNLAGQVGVRPFVSDPLAADIGGEVPSNEPQAASVSDTQLSHAAIQTVYATGFSNVPSSNPTVSMLTQSAYFSKEFWCGDYVNHASALPGEAIPDYLSFWQRLVRTSLVIGYHNLRGTFGYSVAAARSQYRYSLSHATVAYISWATRAVLGRFEMAQPWIGPPRPQASIASLFSHPEFHRFTHDTQELMSANGEAESDYLDAEEVEKYLTRKGMFYVDKEILQMRWQISSGSNPAHYMTKLVELDVKRFIEVLTNLSLCLGQKVGYPKSWLDRAISASATRLID